jgi:glyoxylase-like metal-dependent hydrolase (beta-lactamase superfamily II)
MLLARLEASLAGGIDTGGRALTNSTRLALDTNIRQRRTELESLVQAEMSLPNRVFDTELVVQLGNRRVELKNWGAANSPDDITVYLPDEGVLFTGDIVVQAPFPYTGSSWPVPWTRVLRDIENIRISAMVPGHGPVMFDHRYTTAVRQLMEAVVSRVTALATEGKSLAQLQSLLDVRDVRALVPAWNEPGLDARWKAAIDRLAERAWMAVRGQG